MTELKFEYPDSLDFLDITNREGEVLTLSGAISQEEFEELYSPDFSKESTIGYEGNREKDPEYRTSRYISKSSIKINKVFSEYLKETLVDLLDENKFSLSFNKLVLYNKGDFFDTHTDRLRKEGHFMTVSITLPTEKKGTFDFKVNGKKNKYRSTSSKECILTAFDPLDSHSITQKTGYRVALIFHLSKPKKRSYKPVWAWKRHGSGKPGVRD